MRIEYTPKFGRQYKKLTKELKAQAKKKEKIFRSNPFDPRLKTHKLGGRLSNYWAFWIDYRNRIMFSFVDKDIVRFHVVGDHDIYK